MEQKKREQATHNEPIGVNPVESVVSPEPFTTVALGIADLVESTVFEIGEILSPEETRRRELSSVIRNRGMGRER